MIHFITSGGPGMYLFIVLAAVIIGLSIKKTIDIYGKKTEQTEQLKHGINSILFWGIFCIVLGYLWHYIGLYIAFGAISQAREISPAIVARGYQQSLVTILTGLFLFVIAFLCWFFLRSRCR